MRSSESSGPTSSSSSPTTWATATSPSYGGTDIRTPHIDRLVREGVRLTDFYANGATCTPTRAGLITGRYQQRFELEAPLGAGGAADAATRTEADGPLAAAASQERRICHGAGRQMAPRLEAGVQPDRARLRLLLRFQERIHRLLSAHERRRRGERRPVRERRGGHGSGLHDGPHHRSLGRVHREECAAPVLHRRGVQRAALAVPGARQAVGGARFADVISRRSTARRARAPTTSR